MLNPLIALLNNRSWSETFCVTPSRRRLKVSYDSWTLFSPPSVGGEAPGPPAAPRSRLCLPPPSPPASAMGCFSFLAHVRTSPEALRNMDSLRVWVLGFWFFANSLVPGRGTGGGGGGDGDGDDDDDDAALVFSPAPLCVFATRPHHAAPPLHRTARLPFITMHKLC